MPSWAQRQFRASPRPRGNDAFDGHRHDLTRAYKLPCETIHLVLVILATRRNKIFPRHGAASHYIHNAEGHSHGRVEGGDVLTLNDIPIAFGLRKRYEDRQVTILEQ